jgi:hypothetical protein
VSWLDFLPEQVADFEMYRPSSRQCDCRSISGMPRHPRKPRSGREHAEASEFDPPAGDEVVDDSSDEIRYYPHGVSHRQTRVLVHDLLN